MFDRNILMCMPGCYGLEYKINPWMDLKNKPDRQLAKKQWFNLHHLIIRLGGYVLYLDPIGGLPDCPDIVFTANAGLVYKDCAIVSNFKFFERKREVEFFEEFFWDNGFECLKLASYIPFEGAGDALFGGDKLFGGYGFRTSKLAYDYIKIDLGLSEIVLLELIDSNFYHLDTCFCPLGDNMAIYYPRAFSDEGVKAIKDNFDTVFAVPEPEARNFACNAVVLGYDIVLPSGCPKTEGFLTEIGRTPHSTEMGEFIKAGGACKCLTLELNKNDKEIQKMAG